MYLCSFVRYNQRCSDPLGVMVTALANAPSKIENPFPIDGRRDKIIMYTTKFTDKEGITMELSLLLLEKILSMALMVLMGYGVVRLGGIGKGKTAPLSGLTLYIICPCMILSAFQIEMNVERLTGLLLALIAAVVLHVVFILMTRVIGDKLGLDGVERASLIYSNGGNLIVPLVSSLLGEEYVFYCCAFIAFQTVLVWVHLPRLLVKGYRPNLRKILLNPNILSIAAGLILFLSGIRFTGIIADTIDSVSGTIGPIAMLMIGMLMAEVDLKRVFTSWRSWVVTFGRLIVYPVVMIMVILVSGVTRWMPGAREVLLVTMLATCAPIAVSISQMADIFGGDSVKASALNVMTVIFCIITMPLVIALYQFLC